MNRERTTVIHTVSQEFSWNILEMSSSMTRSVSNVFIVLGVNELVPFEINLKNNISKESFGQNLNI